jgi:hypothetical protein
MIELKNHINPYKLPCKFYAMPDFPSSVVHKNKTYWKTGKLGVTIKDHIPSAEYSFVNGEIDARLWLDANKNIMED